MSGVRVLAPNSKKIILKVFDAKNSFEKRSHTCSVCTAYKREISKGNKEALAFYKMHIAEVARKNHGVTIVLYGKDRQKMLSSLGALAGGGKR